jgi:D-3-phosphoglycerate dehydrogenase
MSSFTVVLFEHGYGSTRFENDVIARAGGQFIDASDQPLEQALRLCERADGILVRRLQFTRPLLSQLRCCKVMVRYGVGFDNIDLDAATDAGIIVSHVPVYCVDEVSNHAIGLLLACVRHLVSTHQKLERGAWDVNRSDPVFRTAGRTLGLAGLGNLGRAVARKMAAWDLRLIAFDPYVDPAKAQALGVTLVDFDTLCRESDYLSLHVPLLTETRHLIDERALALMKPGAILVNTARGPVIDTNALLAALDSGHIAQAGLDVFEEEPLPADSPLRSHPKVVLTDHMAWYSEESQAELQTRAAEEIVRVCRGGLPNAVANPEVLHRLNRWRDWTPSEAYEWQQRRAKHHRAAVESGRKANA